MDIFISHSFSDIKKVEEIIKFCKNNCNDYFDKIRVLKKNHKRNWKQKVEKYLKSSPLFICTIGSLSASSPNIEWEINEAIQNNLKIIVIKLSGDVELPHQFNNYQTIIINDYKSELKDKIKTVLSLDDDSITNILINDLDDKSRLFEQYKIMLDSSEKLIERRNKTNTFFLSANGLLITTLGLLSKSYIENNFSFIYLILISIIGVILCISWHSLLKSFGQLNKGKYSIILLLEKYFPASVYRAEWQALAQGNNPKIYQSFTNSEKRIPLIIMSIYIVFTLFLIIINLIKYWSCYAL